MGVVKSNSLEAFYTKFGASTGKPDLAPYTGGERPMLFGKRLYYKISLCEGLGQIAYGDQVLNIAQGTVFLATPRVPCR